MNKLNSENRLRNSGQSLVSLLFFMIVAVTVASASAIILLVNSLSTASFQEGLAAFAVAESGAENAILRLLRDPAYSGESVVLEKGTAQISVSGSNPKIVNSIGRSGNFQRQIQINIVINNGVYSTTSWKEIF